jgi:hypothetical protein
MAPVLPRMDRFPNTSQLSSTHNQEHTITVPISLPLNPPVAPLDGESEDQTAFVVDEPQNPLHSVLTSRISLIPPIRYDLDAIFHNPPFLSSSLYIYGKPLKPPAPPLSYTGTVRFHSYYISFSSPISLLYNYRPGAHDMTNST